MSHILLENIKEVYTAEGNQALTNIGSLKSIPNAAIWVSAGRIAQVGPREEVRKAMAAEGCLLGAQKFDMQQRVAVPTFVDPHTHLVFGGERSGEFNRRLHGETYSDIAASGGGIKSTVAQTRAASQEQLAERAGQTLNHMLQHGVGTIEAKSGYGLDLETEVKQLDVMRQLQEHHPIDIIQTFLGAHEVPPEYKGRSRDYLEHLNREVLPVVAQRGDVVYADIFCEKGVFEIEDSRMHMQAALDQGFKLRMHVDELHPLGGAGLAAELGAVTGDHLVYASKEDMGAMAAAGTMPVLLPGTSFFLRGRYADADGFKAAGCPIALSTDFNPGSSHTISQPLMMALACMNLGMTFEESFVGVTLNAAASLDLADQIGTLEAGKKAHIAFLDVPSPMHLVYYWGLNHVSDVVLDGAFRVRNRQLV